MGTRNNRPKSVGLCRMEKPAKDPGHMYRCFRRKDHVLKTTKYMSQHMDSKHTPPVYWTPTEEEIEQVRKELADNDET